ncbi:hypothetical protein CK203_058849 [Vitis vinifera]|uniref:Uncharacterized protein n=1 Tax=Vitis vinifera TaxID=29760 RepID=A0A438G8Q9_VITVI|nr:hypothetical protein CK203_058849 [Vitis vinifera]
MIPDRLYNLKDLQIGKCENVKLQSDQLQALTSLTSLKITNCENIKTPLSEWGLAKLISLKTLSISDYHHHHPLLLPTTLAELFISSFRIWNPWPSYLSKGYTSLDALSSNHFCQGKGCLTRFQSYL